MIRLLALDLDGTVIDDSLTISPVVLASVRRVIAAGVYVTLVTGRMCSATLPYARKLGVGGFIVCYHGAVVMDIGSGTVLREIPVPHGVAMRLYEQAKSDGVHVQLYSGDRFYVEATNRHTAFYARLAGIEPLVVDSLARTFAGRDSTKVNLIADAAEASAYSAVVRKVVGDEAYVTRSLPELIEILSPHVDKGAALRWVAQALDIPLEQTMAIGDSYNDLPLLSTAGIGVAMGSAPCEVKKAADAVVGDYRADGVAEAIERFIFDGEQA